MNPFSLCRGLWNAVKFEYAWWRLKRYIKRGEISLAKPQR